MHIHAQSKDTDNSGSRLRRGGTGWRAQWESKRRTSAIRSTIKTKKFKKLYTFIHAKRLALK